MDFFHLKTSGFLQVLRTRDRIVRSNTWFIQSLLTSAFAGYRAIATAFSMWVQVFQLALAFDKMKSCRHKRYRNLILNWF